MTLNELNELFKNVDDKVKGIIAPSFPTYIWELEKINELRMEIDKIGIPKNKAQAEKKRYLIKEYSDISQRNDAKEKIYLSVLNKADVGEESNLVKLLKGFE